MAITSGSANGLEVTTAAMNESLGSQTNQTGNNTVVVSDTLANQNNGNITAPTGYVGRMCIIRQGTGTEETRYITAEAATGTGTEVRLTVNEDWLSVPVATTDTIHVSYSSDDMEAFTGMTLNAKTGVYEGGGQREWAIGQGTVFAYAAIIGFQGWEVPDRGGTEAGVEVENNGRLDIGYVQGGVGIQGGIITAINNVATEPVFEVKAGGILRCYSSLFRSWLTTTAWQARSTADVVMDGFTIKDMTDDLLVLDGDWTDGVVAGNDTTGEYLRMAEEATMDGLILSNTAGLHTEDTDVTTETLTLANVTFIGNIDYITLVNNKTWDMINPVWEATTNADFEDTAVTGSATVNDRRSVDAVVQEADGTKLQNALVNVYENTILADLVVEEVTDVNGVASSTFLYKDHIWTTGTGATQTYGGHALQAGKWLYLPFVSSQVSTDFFDGIVVLSPDNNIVQTTQATALTDGAGIVWNEDTNPSELFDFTLGSGTLAVGMILTFTPSGATGTITDSLDGDSVTGTLHLDTRNATAIANGDTFSRTGGTAGTFSGTYTNATTQPFSIHIDGNAKSYQTIYDYLAAKQNETTLSVDGELIWEWCRDTQTQPLYATGASFYTEESSGKGLIILDGGAGTVDYFTDDNGVTWTPPSTVTLTVQVDDADGIGIAGARVRIELDSDGSLVSNGSTNGSGLYTDSFTYTIDTDVLTKVRLKGYKNFRASGTITSSGLTIGVTLATDKIVDLP